jgi:hypothetical protein
VKGTGRLLLFLAVVYEVATAHDIITTKLTFTRDISRIFARHCVACHSETATIPLVTYEEVRPWAVSIKEQVLSRAMPPFGAVKGFGRLMPDEALSQEDITIIAAWVVGGAPQGDPAQLPKVPPNQVGRTPVPAMVERCVVETRTVLRNSLQASGIKPLTNQTVPSARVVATLPDGRMIPLVWLYNYDPKFARTFQFAEPVLLPAGTVVSASAPLQYALESASGSEEANR